MPTRLRLRRRLLGKVLGMLRIRHIRTRPYTPKTNGKAEHFIQTLMREWAYAVTFPIILPPSRRPAKMDRLVQSAPTPC